jgi:hypothetical protein
MTSVDGLTRKLPRSNLSDLLKLRLARPVVFCFLRLTKPQVFTTKEPPKLPSCLTSLLYQLPLRTAGPTAWVKALPYTIEDRVLSFFAFTCKSSLG